MKKIDKKAMETLTRLQTQLSERVSKHQSVPGTMVSWRTPSGIEYGMVVGTDGSDLLVGVAYEKSLKHNRRVKYYRDESLTKNVAGGLGIPGISLDIHRVPASKAYMQGRLTGVAARPYVKMGLALQKESKDVFEAANEKLKEIRHSLEESKTPVFAPYSHGQWVIRVEDYLQKITGKKWTFKKPILTAKGGKEIHYKWVGRKPRGKSFKPVFLVKMEYNKGSDLFDVEASYHDADLNVAGSKTLKGLQIGNLLKGETLFGWVKRKWDKKTGMKAESVEESKKLTPEALIAYLKKSKGSVNVAALDYSFGMGASRITKMLDAMVKKGQLKRTKKKGRPYQYSLAESLDEGKGKVPKVGGTLMWRGQKLKVFKVKDDVKSDDVVIVKAGKKRMDAKTYYFHKSSGKWMDAATHRKLKAKEGHGYARRTPNLPQDHMVYQGEERDEEMDERRVDLRDHAPALAHVEYDLKKMEKQWETFHKQAKKARNRRAAKAAEEVVDTIRALKVKWGNAERSAYPRLGENKKVFTGEEREVLESLRLHEGKPTFAKAKQALMDYLKSKGWTVQLRSKTNLKPLKIPYADDPHGEHRLWFKKQAIYLGSAQSGSSINHARSLHLDVRGMTPEEFMKKAERWMD